MLPYSVYFETLSAIGDQDSPDWLTTFAGLVVLRLVSDWLDFGHRGGCLGALESRNAKDMIARIPDSDPVKAHLARILSAVEHAEQADLQAITPHVAAYASHLALDGQSALAEDALVHLRSCAEQVQNHEALIAISRELAIVQQAIGTSGVPKHASATTRRLSRTEIIKFFDQSIVPRAKARAVISPDMNGAYTLPPMRKHEELANTPNTNKPS